MAKEETKAPVPQERNSLYDLVTLSQEIQRKLFECAGELTPEVEAEIIELEKKLPSKVDGYKFVTDELRNNAVLWKKRAADMAQVSKQYEAYADKLDDIMSMALERSGDVLEGVEYYAKRQKASKQSIVIEDASKILDGHKETTLSVSFSKNDTLSKAIKGAILTACDELGFNPPPNFFSETDSIRKADILDDLVKGIPVTGAKAVQTYYVKYYPNSKGVKNVKGRKTETLDAGGK